MSRFDLGLRALDGKDFGLAIRCFDEAIRLDPALSYYRPHSTLHQTLSAGRECAAPQVIVGDPWGHLCQARSRLIGCPSGRSSGPR